MDIGTGIAIAGVWMLPALSAISKSVTGGGMWVSIFIAIGMTVFLTT